MIKLERLIDNYVGTIIIILLSFFKKKNKVNSKNKVLFIKLWAVGESVLTLNLIKEFKERNKKSKITILCRRRNISVYRNLKFIDNIIVFEKDTFKSILNSFKNYDLAFDLEPYLKISAILSFYLSKTTIGFSHSIRRLLYDITVKYNDKQHIMKTYLDLLKPFKYKIKIPTELISLSCSIQRMNNITAFIKKINPRKKVIIGLTTTSAETSKYRRWLPERFAELADKLIEKTDCIILFPDAKSNNFYVQNIIEMMNHKEKAFNLAGKFFFKDFFCLVKKCDLYISNDTGPMHIAAAQKIRTIGLFGPNTPVRFAPYGKRNTSIYNCKHKPYVNPHLGSFEKPKHFCMEQISVDEVFKESIKLLKRK